MTDPQPPVPPVPTPGGFTPPPVPTPDGVTPPVATPPPAAPPAYPNPPAYPAYGQPATPGAYSPPTNTLAIVALVLSFFVSIGGIICGHIALSQIKRTGEGGRGLAIAALIIGYVITALVVLYIIGIIIFAIWAATSSASYSY